MEKTKRILIAIFAVMIYYAICIAINILWSRIFNSELNLTRSLLVSSTTVLVFYVYRTVKYWREEEF